MPQRGAGRADLPVGVHHPRVPGWREQERHRQRRAEQRRRRVGRGHAREHPGQEPPGPEGGDVRRDRDLLVRRPVHVVEDGPGYPPLGHPPQVSHVVAGAEPPLRRIQRHPAQLDELAHLPHPHAGDDTPRRPVCEDRQATAGPPSPYAPRKPPTTAPPATAANNGSASNGSASNGSADCAASNDRRSRSRRRQRARALSTRGPLGAHLLAPGARGPKRFWAQGTAAPNGCGPGPAARVIVAPDSLGPGTRAPRAATTSTVWPPRANPGSRVAHTVTRGTFRI